MLECHNEVQEDHEPFIRALTWSDRCVAETGMLDVGVSRYLSARCFSTIWRGSTASVRYRAEDPAGHSLRQHAERL